MPNAEAAAAARPKSTSVGFLVFLASLFDTVHHTTPRPFSDLLHVPTLPIRSNFAYRIQVNLLWYLRNYLNLVILSTLMMCAVHPWLVGLLVLAVLLHVESAPAAPAAAAAQASAAGDREFPAASADAAAEAAAAESSAPPWRWRLLSCLQGLYCCFLVYHYGPLRFACFFCLPGTAIVAHASVTRFTDASSREYEEYCRRLLQRASGPRIFSPVRPSTPVRRWRNDRAPHASGGGKVAAGIGGAAGGGEGGSVESAMLAVAAATAAAATSRTSLVSKSSR